MELPGRHPGEEVSWTSLKTQDAAIQARIDTALASLGKKRPRHVNLVEALVNPDADPGPELQNIIEEALDAEPEKRGSYLATLMRIFTGETAKSLSGLVTSAALVQAAQSMGAVNFEAKPSEEGVLGFVQQASVEDWARAAIQFASDVDTKNRNRNNAILLTNFIIQSLAAAKAGRQDGATKVAARIITRSLVVPQAISKSIEGLPWVLEFAANAGPKYLAQYFSEQFAKFSNITEEELTTDITRFIPQYVKDHSIEIQASTEAIYEYVKESLPQGIERNGFTLRPDTLLNYLADRAEETFNGLGIEPATEHYVQFEDIPVVGEANNAINFVEDTLNLTMQMLENGALTLTKELAAIVTTGVVLVNRRENGADAANAGSAYMFVRVLYNFLSRFSNIT